MKNTFTRLKVRVQYFRGRIFTFGKIGIKKTFFYLQDNKGAKLVYNYGIIFKEFSAAVKCWAKGIEGGFVTFLMKRTFLGWSTRSFVFGVDFCLTLFSRIIFMFKDLTKIVTEFGNSLTYLLESQTRVDLCKKYGGPNLVTQYIICNK